MKIHDENPNINSRKNHREILDDLLKEIKPLNIREYLKLPNDIQEKQKYVVVAVVKHLLEQAELKQWNLSKVHDYIYVFNGAYWKQLNKETLKSFLGKVAINIGYADYEALHFQFKDMLLKQFLTDAHLPAPDVEQDKVMINLQNGTMEFTNDGWKLRDFNPIDFLTYQLPFGYSPDATCPMFDKYLLEVLPDLESRMVLQEFSGYIFTKLNLEKMLMLTGTGANGKSVFFKIISALVGRENLLTYSMGLFSTEYNRAKLTNVLLNYSSEKGTELNPDIFKALVSGEPLQARLPYGQPFTITNKVRFIINANELPKETEQTEAYFRRYLIVPFDVTIPEFKRDIFLAEKIIENELAGVFNWVLEGLDRIIKQEKFTLSQKSDGVLKEFRRQTDSVALFIDEFNLVSAVDVKMPLTDLYFRYKAFCQDDGYKPLGKNKFSYRIENKGFEKTRLGNGSIAFLMRVEPYMDVQISQE